MTLGAIQSPYDVFLGLNGAALNGGHIYIGVAGQDPQTNPLPVFWDAAGTTPATQPIDIIGGYACRAGTPAQAYVMDDYSIRVTDRFGVQVYYAASGYRASSASQSLWIAPGSGAIVRDVQTKLRERVGPIEYGADGTLDQTPFYSAMNANTAIFVAAGTYDMNAPFVVGAGKIVSMQAGAVITGPGLLSTDIAPGGEAEGYSGGTEGKTRFWAKRLTGAVAPAGGVFGSFTSGYMFDIQSDDRDVGSDFSVGLRLRHQFGGSVAKGGREGIAGAVYLTAPTNIASNNRNYVGIAGKSIALTGDGGTALDIVNARGGFFGLSSAVYAPTGATFLGNVCAAELNTFMNAGASTNLMFGVAIALCNETRGAEVDCFIGLSGIGAANGYGPHIGTKHGFLITNRNSADPFYSASTLLGTYWIEGPATVKTIAYGIDIRGLNCVNGAFLSVGFSVGSTGNIAISNTSATIEMGSKTASGIPLIDFNSSGNNNDYDARIAGTGGTGASGGGTLQVVAATLKLPADTWVGAFTGGADVASNGYVTIKDAAGNTRKLMTTA
jgi:hypothetical protein